MLFSHIDVFFGSGVTSSQQPKLRLDGQLCKYSTLYGWRHLAREAAQTAGGLEKLHKERDFYILVNWKIGAELLVLLSICNIYFPPTNRTVITLVTSSRKAKIASRPTVEALRRVTLGFFQHFETTTFETTCFPTLQQLRHDQRSCTNNQSAREDIRTSRCLEKLQKQPHVCILVS